MSNNRDKNFSTIIVTGKNHSQTRSFTVRTQYVKYFKGYFLFASLLMCLLIVAVISLSFYVEQQHAKANDLALQVMKLQNVSPVKKGLSTGGDSLLTQTYITQIQAKLGRVSAYLKARGVKGFSNIAVGGSNKKNSMNITPNEKLELYDEYVTRLFNGLELIPLGYPHEGSVSSVFGYRSDPFVGGGSELHGGIDFRGETGEKVKSTASGHVVWASWYQGYGKCVRVAHANGYQTLYGHLSEIKVKTGKKVHAGDIIGYVGSTGRSTGPHLHYEVRLNNKSINPNKFLSL